MRKLFCNYRVLYKAVAEGLISNADLDHGIFLVDICGNYAAKIRERALYAGADPYTAKMVADAFHKALLDGRVAFWRNEVQGDLHKTLLSLNVVFERTIGVRMEYHPEEVWPEFASLYAICQWMGICGVSHHFDLVSVFYIQREKRLRCVA